MLCKRLELLAESSRELAKLEIASINSKSPASPSAKRLKDQRKGCRTETTRRRKLGSLRAASMTAWHPDRLGSARKDENVLPSGFAEDVMERQS